MAKSEMLEMIQESKEYLTPLQYTLIKTLQNLGPLTRRDLVRKLGTPRTTIYDNLIKLQKRKRIEKFSRSEGRKGRPLVFWKLRD